MPEDIIPKDIATQGEGFVIRWSDGHVGFYPFRHLRYNCMCALCVNEWTRERQVVLDSIPAGIRPLKAEYVGHYAIQIDWNDGHNTGIYTFEQLRSICQCADCLAQKNT